MQGLSYGVVRVEDENSLMSLTLQDCGQVLPGGTRSYQHSFHSAALRLYSVFTVISDRGQLLLVLPDWNILSQ